MGRTEIEFFLKKFDAQVSFIKDVSGKVTELIVHQGGQDITAKKFASAIAV